MILTFLGTAAAEGIPAPFCDCATCSHARSEKGKNVRKRSAVLLNDDLLIDIGPDVYSSCGQLGISLVGLNHLLVTHSHVDHFYPPHVNMRHRHYRKNSTIRPMTLAAGRSVMKMLNPDKDAEMDLTRLLIEPFQTFTLAPYTIYSLAASHALDIGDAMNYMLSDGMKTLLFASDTGFYTEQVWDDIRGHAFDLVVMESTLTTNAGALNKQHLNFEGVQTMLGKLREIGSVSEQTSIYVTHFSHQGGPSHEELEALYGPTGVNVAYDGLVVEI